MDSTQMLLETFLPCITCPITKRVMSDPAVLCANGISYERTAIEEWIEQKGTDPESNAPLVDRRLVPNTMLARLIKDFSN
jgi:hypothetical protein